MRGSDPEHTTAGSVALLLSDDDTPPPSALVVAVLAITTSAPAFELALWHRACDVCACCRECNGACAVAALLCAAHAGGRGSR